MMPFSQTSYTIVVIARSLIYMRPPCCYFPYKVVATYIQRKEKSSSVHYSSLEGVQEVQAQLEA